MSATRYWVWLSALRGLRPTALRLLMDYFGDPMDVYFAPEGEYDKIEGLLPRERQALRDKCLTETGRIMDVCAGAGVRVLTRQDADYPLRLAQIYDAPPVLYVRGRLPFLDESPVVALVGTRSASVYGLRTAARRGAELTQGGALVVSGLALGVDASAAKGALFSGGVCVGVLGSAIDVDYPRQNARLIADVAAAGAVLSEFPPGYPTLAENFPRRNRIISGLSAGVCVVEAPARSGALITAELALEQGRDLFVVPGNVDNPACAGSNALLRDCAKAATCARDILVEYQALYPDRVDTSACHGQELPAAVCETPGLEEKTVKAGIDNEPPILYSDLDNRIGSYPERQQSILQVLRQGETHVDTVIADTGMSAAAVLSELTLLTIDGAVTSLSGKRYSLNL